ncbi:alpha/beta hydrolase [Ferrovibrio terrae]|uniref:Alpha/beta hydrolase n=1 Tax=Ferrovibrio terrae TaxID=2594003 RepID=A0A516H0Y8_9PROT|nr:alpha/beta hydrolase [Ferrovibrio terrae]QDO97416.1 alpha/beta hydrolase [Ferrovibrio terrae]
MRISHKIASGRATLAAEVSGSGSPVVFLHAAVCDSRMWRAQLDAAAASHLAIAYDRRGFGQTVAETEDHSAVGDLLSVIDTVAPGAPAILVACSQGGRVALDAALLHPARIRHLVLISPSVSGAPDPVLSPEIQALMAAQKTAEDAGDLDRVNALKAHLWLDGPLQPEGRVSGPARELFLDMNGIALRASPAGANIDTVTAFRRLGEITAPALVICGEADFSHIHARSRDMAAAMPNASFHSLHGAAHLPSLERPADIARLLMAYLAGT